MEKAKAWAKTYDKTTGSIAELYRQGKYKKYKAREAKNTASRRIETRV